MSIYAKKAYEEKGIVLEGSGGQMMDDIKVFTLSFNCYDYLTLEQTRALVVQVVDEFLEQVNAHEKIRPHLHNYPLTVKNVFLMISFRNRLNKRPPKEYIALAYTHQDQIYYSHWDSTKMEASKFCDDFRESFHDAVKIVMQQENMPQLQKLLVP
ncbi:MAG: hypothetical protein JSS10_01205 [Verrucomicrobia bacterium]|nr:hypothetical protein [Verrucomicrobiota bacterium]